MTIRVQMSKIRHSKYNDDKNFIEITLTHIWGSLTKNPSYHHTLSIFRHEGFHVTFSSIFF